VSVASTWPTTEPARKSPLDVSGMREESARTVSITTSSREESVRSRVVKSTQETTAKCVRRTTQMLRESVTSTTVMTGLTETVLSVTKAMDWPMDIVTRLTH
jgi:hypothetical protein